MLAPGRDQVHFDIFFDAKNQNMKAGKTGAKKDGQTGIFCIAELLDAVRAPDGLECLLKLEYPDGRHLILTGDTGNGYRAYEMLEELSGLFANLGTQMN